MAVPRPSEAMIATFRSVVQAGPGAVERPMFGQLAGVVNGNMFLGLFGDAINVRVAPQERAAALAAGATPFAPMGRPMTGFFLLSPEMVANRATLEDWVARAYRYAANELPAKVQKPRAPRKG